MSSKKSKLLDSYNYLVKKMIEPNPSKRFSIIEVIKYAKWMEIT